MGLYTSLAVGLACTIGAANAWGHKPADLCNSGTSLTLLYQNNLNFTDDANHIGTILLDPMTMADGVKACAAISENLLSQAAIQNHTCLLYTSPSPRDRTRSRMPSSA